MECSPSWQSDILVLERDQRQILLGVIEQLFQSVDQFGAFLATLGQNLEEIVKGNLEVSRVMVVDRAERREWLIDLIKALRQEAGAALKAELDKIGTIEEIEEARFYDDCYPNGEPLVNRRELRAKLRSAGGDDAKRILLVKGDRYTGKSHALRHIRHVSTKLGIPLAEFALREYATGEEVRPYDFGPAIADALGRPLPQHLDAKVSRWSLNFLNWLGYQVAPNRDRLWLVFDDFEKEKLKVVLPDSIYEFIQMLADRVAGRLASVRLFLINYDRELPGEVSFHLDREDVPGIHEDDIADFFLDFYRDYLPPTDIQKAATDSAERARVVAAKMAVDPATRLDVMRKALRVECETLKGKKP